MRGVKYLIIRGETYWYSRRVPKELNALLPQTFINISLKTKDFNEAAGRIAEINRQTEQYFKTVTLNGVNETEQEKYLSAIKRAQHFGFVYRDAEAISPGPLNELQDRLEVAEKHIDNPAIIEAVLGGVDEPEVKLSNCFETYHQILKSEIRNKSALQLKHWTNSRRSSLKNFIDVVGDKKLVDLTRNDALAFRDYWLLRLADENKAANTANKQFGHLQRIVRTVSEHYRLPYSPLFSGLRFEEFIKLPRLPFETNFILEKLLAPGTLPKLADAGVALIHLMSDSGARPAELIGAGEAEIHLAHDIPYVHIKENEYRTLKTRNSEREIPLIGHSLKAAENGAFEVLKKYREHPDRLTTLIGAYLKRHKIVPSEQYTLYSLRHAFSDRMIAAEVPDRMQDYLMGHKFDKPSYGLGPALAKRKEWLEKAALPPL